MPPDAPQDPAPTTHVLFCANSGYFQHTAVALASLAHFAPNANLCVYVLTCDHDREAEQKLARTAAIHKNLRLFILRVEQSLLGDVFFDGHVSKETYLRILAPGILPESVHRVLYLDSDLVVQDDVTQLFNASLDGKAAAGVADPHVWNPVEDRFLELGVRTNETYVNAGVLLMDLDRWRRDGISRRILDYAVRQGGRLKYHDQDALNAVLVGDIRVLDSRWNVHAFAFTRTARRILPGYVAATDKARRNPGVVHFSSGQKPWSFRSTCRRKEIYFRFLRMTDWRSEGLEQRKRHHEYEHRLAVSAIRFGMDIYVPMRAVESVRRIGGPAFARVRAAGFRWSSGRKGMRSCQRERE